MNSRAVRRVGITIAALAVMLSLAAFINRQRSRWDSDITIDSFHGRRDDSFVELCASGHFAQGFEGEILWTLGMRPSDNGLDECVIVEFAELPRPGVWHFEGVGHRLVSGGSDLPFTAGPDHAPEIRSVWTNRTCFCSDYDEVAPLTGTLTIDALEPLRGRFVFSAVPTTNSPGLTIDKRLRSFSFQGQPAGSARM